MLNNGAYPTINNPFAILGDLRVLKTAGDLPELSHLIDVVVFSSKGDR